MPFTRCLISVVMCMGAALQAQVIEETAEGPGFSYPWTEVSAQCAPPNSRNCNSIAPDVPTSQIPCTPAHWGSESIIVWSRLAHREALARHNVLPVTSALTTIQFAVLQDAVALDEVTLISATKDGHGPEVDEIPAWTLHLVGSRWGLSLIRLSLAGTPFEWSVAPCRLTTVTIWWSAASGWAYAWSNGGYLGGTMIQPDDAQDIEWVVIGNSSSSNGSGSVVALDAFRFKGW